MLARDQRVRHPRKVRPLKIIFLDIDGVLNSETWLRNVPFIPYSTDEWERDINQLDPNAVRLLNQIIRETGASLVLSSTWRILTPIPRLVNLLRQRANDVGEQFLGEFIGCTPVLSGSRGSEISSWMSLVRPDKFVILDDDDDMDGLPLVQTDFSTGLTSAEVDAAIEVLNG